MTSPRTPPNGPRSASIRADPASRPHREKGVPTPQRMQDVWPRLTVLTGQRGTRALHPSCKRLKLAHLRKWHAGCSISLRAVRRRFSLGRLGGGPLLASLGPDSPSLLGFVSLASTLGSARRHVGREEVVAGLIASLGPRSSLFEHRVARPSGGSGSGARPPRFSFSSLALRVLQLRLPQPWPLGLTLVPVTVLSV